MINNLKVFSIHFRLHFGKNIIILKSYFYHYIATEVQKEITEVQKWMSNDHRTKSGKHKTKKPTSRLTEDVSKIF